MKKNIALSALAIPMLFLMALSMGQTTPPAKAEGQAPPKHPNGPTQGTPPPSKPAWEEFKLNPKTTLFLDFTDANPDMIISIFSRTSGITIIKDPNFKIPLTVTSAKAVHLKEAFEIFNTVLNLNGYQLQKKGNLMLLAKIQPQMVSQPPPQAPPVPVIKTYTLQYANATQVARVITDVFAAAPASGGGSPQPSGSIQFSGVPIQFGGPTPGGAPGGAKPATVKASAEDYSNSVVVSALPQDQTAVEALIKDLDKPTTQPLESQLFHLKYVPVDEVLPAIEDILTSNSPLGRGSGRSGQNQGNPFDIFYGFSPFGSSSSRRTAGGQTATAIKATNSLIVNALKSNIELVRKVLDNMDQPSSFVGTTFVIKLENAKASDVADLLTKAFTQRSNSNDNSPFFFISDFYGPNRNDRNQKTTDLDENGEIVNVRDIVGKVNILADPNTNSLIIVTQPSNMKMIREVIGKLDEVAEQVMIETIIVEANLDKTTKLGVEWSFLNNKFFRDPSTSGSGTTTFGLQTATPALEGLKYTISHQDYQLFLHALQTDTRFKVLDTPKIFTSNNVKAEINVSQKLPYITSQQAGVQGNLITTYQFEDVGVVLNVTPRITSSGQVSMEVVQKADDLQGFTSFNAPIINHRQASTTVSVADGETIVLGGIIRHTQNVDDRKVPLFGDLPLIGGLFRSSTRSNGQTELMVFLTPHIVRTPAEALKIRQAEIERLSKQSQDSVKKQIPPPTGGSH